MSKSRSLVNNLLPPGPAFQVKPEGDLDKFLDGFSDNLEADRIEFLKIQDVKNPYKTPYLSDLEKEYGVVPPPGATEDERREVLASIMFRQNRSGDLDSFQDQLDKAGFSHLKVYANDPATNPDPLYRSTEGRINSSSARATPEQNNWQDIVYSPQERIYVAVSSDGTDRIIYSEDGVAWTEADDEASAWRSLIYAKGIGFVVIGSSGDNQVGVSALGTDWSFYAAVEANEWHGVAHSFDRQILVAVASTGVNRAMFSVDNGETWTASAFGGTQEWKSVARSEELDIFVAVGHGDQVLSSQDGTEWVETPCPQGDWEKVIWVPEKNFFLAVGSSGDHRVMRSFDGETWVVIDSPLEAWTSVSWSKEKELFIATARTGFNRMMVSSDSLQWAFLQVPVYQWQAVTYSRQLEQFTAIASSGLNRILHFVPEFLEEKFAKLYVNNTTFRSRDVFSGTRGIEMGLPGNYRSVVYSDEKELFVAVASGGPNQIITSKNGLDWTSRTVPEANQWYSICYSPSLELFVAVASSGTNRVMTSPDGVAWTARSCPSSDWSSVCWSESKGLFVAVASSASSNNYVMTSPDGVAWTARESSSMVMRSVTWAEGLGLFVAVGSSTANRAMTSPDGIDWTDRTPPIGSWNSVCWSEDLQKLVAVGQVTFEGDNRLVMTSLDGVNWTSFKSINDQGSFTGVVWCPGIKRFVASQLQALAFMFSDDGETWDVVPGMTGGGVGRCVCWSERLLTFLQVRDSTTFGTVFLSDNRNVNLENPIVYKVPPNPKTWPLFVFIGGEATFDENGRIQSIETVAVDASRETSLERIILRFKPLHSWVLLFVSFVNKYDFIFHDGDLFELDDGSVLQVQDLVE